MKSRSDFKVGDQVLIIRQQFNLCPSFQGKFNEEAILDGISQIIRPAIQLGKMGIISKIGKDGIAVCMPDNSVHVTDADFIYLLFRPEYLTRIDEAGQFCETYQDYAPKVAVTSGFITKP